MDEAIRKSLRVNTCLPLNTFLLNFFLMIRFYEGGTPIMVTSDPDILSEVFVKQFSNFYGRKVNFIKIFTFKHF